MPPSKPKPAPTPCPHNKLQLEPSAYAPLAGYTWPSPTKRTAATTKSGTSRGTKTTLSARENDIQLSSFPGPLVLPWDDLGWEPDEVPQSFKDWFQEGHRNKPTAVPERKGLYVFEVPEISDEVGFMQAWMRPHRSTGKDGEGKSHQPNPAAEMTSPPKAQDIVEYVSAFYHGLPTKIFPQRLRFVPWTEKSKSKKKKPQQQQQYVGLATSNGHTTRIRARPSPDGIFSNQLNLDDILDFAIEMLPKDAYAIVLLMHHDLYESEEDDFCCGRAYGGSRVSVVSTARYRPELDEMVGLDSAHMWPASHCKEYVGRLCAKDDIHDATRDVPVAATSPMRAAVDAASRITHSQTPEYLTGLWLSRIVRTVSHELGHCLALAHCTYYACLMQSTSGIAEDVRQPPYLCPVCMSKVSHMVAVEVQKAGDEAKVDYLRNQYTAMAEFCERWKHVGLFAGYQAWLKARLDVLAG